jgi:hypothetical protein
VAKVQQLYVDTLEDWPTARQTPIDAAGTS